MKIVLCELLPGTPARLCDPSEKYALLIVAKVSARLLGGARSLKAAQIFLSVLGQNQAGSSTQAGMPVPRRCQYFRNDKY